MAVAAAADCLAIDRKHAHDLSGNRSGPGHEAGLELDRINRPEHRGECVFGRDSVGEFEKLAEPGLPGVTKVLHVRPDTASAQYRQDGDRDDVCQQVSQTTISARDL